MPTRAFMASINAARVDLIAGTSPITSVVAIVTIAVTVRTRTSSE
ncbi:hypothetical protein [Luteitalea pratensis]|nr:hypothetical protein [Luteitalea pratensis]